ncbi:phage tail tape measure protein, partial [Thalassobius sp. I31.1]|uniref:phage tail tape measure protein n=1 Tax=Thalassobius sp. I31.1 TaxID=2109912 RepID=UPI000D19AAAE
MIPQLGIDVLVGLTNQLTAPLRNAEETVAKASERMNRSLQLSLKLGAAGAAASGVAWGAERMISGFTDSIRAVEQAKGELATLGVQDLDAVVQRGLDMQTQLAGVTADAFVRASYDIKSGISSLTDEGVAEMTASAMLVAKATRGQAEQMTSLFATSYGIFKDQYAMMTDADFGNMFGAALSASVQQFKTDGAAMQQAIESAGAGAVNLGMDMTEQLALLGMMQQQMAAGEAGTALRAFATNAAKAHEAFADLSSESDNPVRVRVLDENGQMRAMPDILADLQARYGETLDAFEAAEIKEAFGTDEAMKMINALYGQEAAVRANAQALDDAAAQGQEFTAQMAAAADNNWDAAMVLMSQKMDVLYQKIGNSLLPVVERIVPYFDAFIERAFTWIDANPGLIAGIGGVVAGLGLVAAVIAPVLLGASALVSTWGTMTFGLVKVATALPLVGKALLFIGRALMANPIGLAVAAIAGAAYLIYEYWEPISTFFGDLWDSVTGYFQGAWDGIAGWFSGLWDRIRSGAVYGWEIIKGLFLNYTPAGLIYTHWESISGWFGGLWENVRAGAENGWLLLKILFLNYHPAAIIYNHWGQITEWFGTLWDNVKSKFTEKWEAIKAEVATWPAEMRTYGSDLIQSLIDGIKAKFAAMAQAVQ